METTPIERISRRGQGKPLTASWNPDDNVGRIEQLLHRELPDGVLVENKEILRQLGQLPVAQAMSPK
jgi:hypothetical protein